MPRTNSRAIFEASEKIIPGGVNSPVRAFPGLDMTPLIACRGAGARVWDADGNVYLDYCGSWGALMCGHAHPAVVAAAEAQLRAGSSFGMATPSEELLARTICGHVSSIEKIRFVSSGTEATMTALRLARGFTGRTKIVKFIGHYHGHSDALLVKAGSGVLQLNAEASSQGVPLDTVRHTHSLPFNDLVICRQFLRETDDVAAVIVEPVAANMGVVPGDPAFLHMLREETARKGIVLIFDEVITGFRLGLQGAQGVYGIAPDLTCLGKIIGGGFPAAAVGGKRAIMDCLAPLGQVYQAGTLSGNPVAMCAGYTTLKLLEGEGFYEQLEKKTGVVVEALRKYIHDANLVGTVTQCGSMFTPFITAYAHLFKHLFDRGIYFAPSPYEANFVSSAHSLEDLEETARIILESLSLQ